MIEALNSPVIQVESLKTKFDTTVVSNSLIALLDYSYEEARFLQQLHYWSHSKYGVVIDGIRWIYKSVRDWLVEVLAGMSEWKLRKTIASLLDKKLIRREKLFAKHQQQEYKSFWWQPRNQTYYYSIDYEELEKLIATAEVDKIPQNTEIVRFENSTELSIEEINETKYCDLSQNRSKNINQKKITTRQSDRQYEDPNNIAAALSETTSKKENYSKNNNTSSSQLSTFPDRTDSNLSSSLQSNRRNKNAAKVEQIINKRRKESISDLDAVGIPINKTLKDLLKLYPKEKVDSAIALYRTRKREQHILNPAGYFTSMLEGEWANKNVLNEESEEIDTASVFRYWYDLARKLGYCSGQEVRDREQWICLSGSWEKWSDAVERGFSLSYLKKILKKSKS